ncbi:MAG: hypothetical protein FWD60_06865 [Candidatus Azobacteroides sp.]|nr:hypothetical protein [Candidatus Azobacteroides sp.]
MMERKNSLLQNLISHEVDILLTEENLKSAGYKFYYFIDTVDINKYAFPFGLVDNRADTSIEVITDEQITYHYFINKLVSKKEYLFLFDEHIKELNDFINRIRRINDIGLPIVDSFKKQADLFNKPAISRDDWEKNKELLSSELNVSYLISIALGSLYDGEKKLKNLIEDKLSYNDPKKLPAGITEELFLSSIPGNITDKLFGELSISYNKDIKGNLNRLIARYKKCMIYDRLISINQKSKNNKILFILVSSARTTNEILPEIVGKCGLNIMVGGIDFKPIRSIQQIYLQLLLQNSKDRIKELNQIKKYAILKEEMENPSEKHEIDELLYQYEQNLSDMRGNYENISLLQNKYYPEKVFLDALKKKDFDNYTNIATSINELLKIAEETHALEKLRSSSLNNIEFIESYNEVLRQAINKIKMGYGSFFAYSGNDPVKNIYDALPLVFFKEGNQNFIDIIKKITDFVRNLPIDNSNSKKLLQSINESFSLLFYKVVPNEEEKIIMLIIFLMLNIGTKEQPDSNEVAYAWIKKMLASNSIAETWKPDFHYIESWICRRRKDYKESIEIAESMLKINPDDPRFHHSLCLGNYCLYDDENEKGTYKQLFYLDKSINNCIKAYRLYCSKQKNDSINLAIISVLNSLAYLYTLKYTSTNELENLTLARQYLDELKIKDMYYDNIAQFLHTEVFLCFQEYHVYHDSERLQFAYNTIQRSIKRVNDKTLKEKYELLKIEIEKELLIEI